MLRRAALLVVLVPACWSSKAPAPPTTPPPPAPPRAEPLALTVDVIRWRCTVNYGGDLETDELAVPLGRPIRLVLHSRDIDHDVAISTGAKASVPARGTATLDFTIDRPGAYTWTCPTDLPPSVPASPDPSTTLAIQALPPGDFDRWVAARREAIAPTTRAGIVALGGKLVDKKGCVSCHTIDGSQRIGPTWKGLWGTTARFVDGGTATVDAGYVRESILYPQKHARPGYPPTMPAFEGMLKEREIVAIVAYIESLAEPKPAP